MNQFVHEPICMIHESKQKVRQTMNQPFTEQTGISQKF